MGNHQGRTDASVDRGLHVFRDGARDGPTNMARDEALLHADAHRPAAVRIYAWEPPTISLGCFQRYARLAELPEKLRGWPIVRRPTGGGAILHDREITYCLVVDESLAAARKSPVELYRLVHALWRDALRVGGTESALAPEHLPLPSPRSGPFLCLEKPGRTDLIYHGQKLLGSAQRRIPGRVLQHGSLLLSKRDPTLPGAELGGPSAEQTATWIERFLDGLARALDLRRETRTWTDDLEAEAMRRRPRFASGEWTRRR